MASNQTFKIKKVPKFVYPVALLSGFSLFLVGYVVLSRMSDDKGGSDIVESVTSQDGRFVAIREFVESEDTELVYVAKASTGYDDRQMCVAVLGPQDDNWTIEWKSHSLNIETPTCLYLRFVSKNVIIDGKNIAIILKPGDELAKIPAQGKQ